MPRKKEPTLWVVVGHNDHEPGSVVRVLDDEEAAKGFAKLCNDYDSHKPIGFDANESDAAYRRWERKYNAWRKKHPAGEEMAGDGYTAIQVPSTSAKRALIATLAENMKIHADGPERIVQLEAALTVAIQQLEGWIEWKCPPRHRPAHEGIVARLWAIRGGKG